MKKIIFSLLLLSTITATAFAGNNKSTSLKGQVVDKQGMPVIGAKILIIETNTIVYTDFDGEFYIHKIPNELSTLSVSMASFEDKKSKFTPDKFQNKAFLIERKSK